MILRVLAALSLLVGGAVLIAYLTVMGRGPWAGPAARHLRAMKDRRAAPARVEEIALPDVQRLPHGLAVAEYAPLEARGVRIEGYVQRMVRAMDGDIHLEVAALPRAAGGPDTAYATAEITPVWRVGHAGWGFERLVRAFRPNSGGQTPWSGGPRRVRVTGWLMYDFQYDNVPSAWSLRYGAARVSGWEIHPVTVIELWDAARGGYVELPR